MPSNKPHLRKWYGAIFLAVATLAVGAIAYRIKVTRNWENVPVKRGSVVQAVYGLGTVTATRTFQLRVGVTVGIREVFVREGDGVSKKAPLLSLDSGVIQYAPFDGTVTAVNYKSGETVFPQAPILSLVDLKNLYVSVSLEQQGALQVRPGQTAILSFENLRAQKFTGIVRSVYPNQGQFMVNIDIDRLPPQILPGMTADVAIEIGRKDDVLLIPVKAISAGKVIVLENGKRKKYDVKLGTLDGEWAEVLGNNLKEGDLLVVRLAKEGS